MTAAIASAQEETEPSDPVASDLIERGSVRLTQIDVAVRGPREIIASLTESDFLLKVHMRWIEDFEADRYCTAPEAGDPLDWQKPLAPAVRYLMYFDQTHLTLAGRAQAIDIALGLLDSLVQNGNEVMIVSSARRMVTIEEFTSDASRLRAALKRMENDRFQWDTYAETEELRVAELMDVLSVEENVMQAVGMARTLQREEIAQADRALRRLAVTVAGLAEYDSNKSLIYFSDTIRQNPGAHYLSFFGARIENATNVMAIGNSAAFGGGLVFDQVLDAATTHGIRIYPIYGHGLYQPADRNRVSAEGIVRGGKVSNSATTRSRDVQLTMGSLASESGGQAFLRGQQPARIAREILDDFSCVYRLSFDPEGYPQDTPLRLIVQTTREDVRLGMPGRIQIQSDSKRLSSRLLRAFAGGSETDGSLRAQIVPTGYRDGSYDALLQITVPPTLPGRTEWELGATLIHRDQVKDEISASMAGQASQPLVLEREIRFKPGPHELVAVAHETGSGFILSEHLTLAWPDPDRLPASCGPLVLLQPESGSFLREDATRQSGSLALAVGEVIDSRRPTALMGLVCRGRRQRGKLQVVRSLVGNTTVEFPDLEFDLAKDRCAQVRDVIPAGTLGPGEYRYEISVLRDGNLAHESAREFIAAVPES